MGRSNENGPPWSQKELGGPSIPSAVIGFPACTARSVCAQAVPGSSASRGRGQQSCGWLRRVHLPIWALCLRQCQAWWVGCPSGSGFSTKSDSEVRFIMAFGADRLEGKTRDLRHVLLLSQPIARDRSASVPRGARPAALRRRELVGQIRLWPPCLSIRIRCRRSICSGGSRRSCGPSPRRLSCSPVARPGVPPSSSAARSASHG